MTPQDAVVSDLFKIIEDSSVKCLKQISGMSEISLVQISKIPIIHAHWMVIILMFGEALRLTFKVHFSSDSAGFFAANTFRTSKDQISSIRRLDFFKEYSNLAGGRIKQILQESGIRAAVSLPVLARGFDELFFPKPQNSELRAWQLAISGESVTCSAYLELFDKITINTKANDELKEDGEVDFL